MGQKNKISYKDYNVILISLDATRADHLGCYGYFRNTSPNIDILAKESILFKNAFSQSSHTLASHMSIFTSLCPYSHGVKPPLEDSLNPNIVTLAQILKMNNYVTSWVALLNDYNLDLKRGFERGFEHFIVECRQRENYKIYYWEDGLRWIKENKNKKFFTFLHTYKTHDPYTPSMSTILKFTDTPNENIISSEKKLDDIAKNKIISDPSIVFKDSFIKENKHIFANKSLLNKHIFANKSILNESLHALIRTHLNSHTTYFNIYDQTFWENVNVFNDSDMNYIKLLYDAEIYEADQDVQRLIDLLKREELMDKTILIITADHGEEFMEHGNIDHGTTLYDEVVHIPLIIWIPDVGGKEISSLVQSIDIMPTILDLVGITIPKHIQGVSLLPLIEGKTRSLNEYVYSETFGNLSSIRSNSWKYITNFNGLEELYNLREDPLEENNLIPTDPEIAKDMKNKLEKHFNEVTSY